MSHYTKSFITTVIPVLNEARYIRDTLMQLVAQEYPKDSYEIFVVDGMSDDETRAIVSEISIIHPQIRLIDNPKRLSSAGRNIGFAAGRGDYFLVVDGHCHIPDNHLFSNLVECFFKSGADCLGRPQHLDPPGLTRFQQSVALARGSKIGHGGDSLIYGDYEGFASPVSNGAAYARHVFDKVGYVDETFDACEDVEFNYRVEKAGLKCFTSPALSIKYYPRSTIWSLCQQLIRYGKGRYKFINKHPETLTFNQLIPSLFVVGLGCFLATLVFYLGTGQSVPLFFTSSLYTLYLVIVMLQALIISIRAGLLRGAAIPAILFIIHFSLGYGFLYEAFQQLMFRGKNRGKSR